MTLWPLRRWWKRRHGICTWNERCREPYAFKVVAAYDDFGDDEHEEPWTLEGLSCVQHAREQVEHFLLSPHRGDRLHLTRRF